MTLTADASSVEEPDLAEKYTESELTQWANKKNSRVSQPTKQKNVLSDPHGLLAASEQHQQGLSVYMKRCRRDIINRPAKPDLVQIRNPRLASYLQEVERFNPELMNRAKTVEHYTLPSTSVIADEKRVMEEEGKKLWHDGLVLRTTSTLIDPNWEREQEEIYISELQRKTKERTTHVLLGVLQQWRESPEKDHGVEAFPPSSSSQSKSSSTGSYEIVKEMNASKDIDSDRTVLETVPEDEEDTDDDRWSTR